MAGTTIRAEFPVVIILVGMTRIAIRGRAFKFIVHMTCRTSNPAMRPSQREARAAMIEVDILPGGRAMTTSTVRAELSVMRILPGMTGITIRRCASIYTVRVAVGTCNPAVTTLQREARSAMVKVNILPAAWVMTVGAITSHLTAMRVFMTGGAVRGCSLEQEILMTTRTGETSMLPHQVEDGLGVIEGHILPGCGCMAGFAVLSQQSHMRIVRFMAGETIHGRAYEQLVRMTTTARYIDMGWQ